MSEICTVFLLCVNWLVVFSCFVLPDPIRSCPVILLAFCLLGCRACCGCFCINGFTTCRSLGRGWQCRCVFGWCGLFINIVETWHTRDIDVLCHTALTHMISCTCLTQYSTACHHIYQLPTLPVILWLLPAWAHGLECVWTESAL